MGPLPAFHHHPLLTSLWFVTYATCVLPEIVFSRRLRSAGDAVRSDRGSMLLVIVAANLAMAAGFLVAIGVAGLTIGPHWRSVFAAGIVVWIGGTLFRWYSIRALGRFFTFDVAISRGRRVIKRGPYRWLRPPPTSGRCWARSASA